MSNITKKYNVDVTRVDTGHYRATNAAAPASSSARARDY